jgi:hypothetical protein
VEQALEGLIRSELVARQPRGPGQKEDRFCQLLGDSAEAVDDVRSRPAEPNRLDELEARVARLEDEVAALREMPPA